MRVVVALSGGVDSSVVALMMKREGHEVLGITMRVWAGDGEGIPPGRSCFGPQMPGEENSAGKVAEWLGIEHRTVSLEEDFERHVFQYYRNEYESGRTPVPCIACNQYVKFDALLRASRDLYGEFDGFATGHYVRTGKMQSKGPVRLREAHDRSKDQTYFLYRVDLNLLERLIFPVGEFQKNQVRSIAKEAGIPVHDRPESKGFYSGNYRDLLSLPSRRGPVVSLDGRILGEHEGYWNFTIGQRKGLELPGEQRVWFVVSTDPVSNTVFVGRKESLLKREIRINSLIWPEELDRQEMRALVRVGNTHPLVPANVKRTGFDEAGIVFDEPVIAIAPGQSAVFYKESFVLGGGIIQAVI